MKLGMLITARLKSSRLPFKLMLDLNGASVIDRVIQRCQAVQNVDTVILCTSTDPQDRPLVNAARQAGIYYFCGSGEDVLSRLWGAARFHELDGFLSITADNPLFSVSHASLLADKARRHFPDIMEMTNLPLGMATYFLKTKAVELGCRMKDVEDTEFWPVVIRRPDLLRIETFDAAMAPEESHRITLDTPQDYEMIRTVYREVPFTGVLNEYDVVKYLDEHPSVSALNRDYVRSWLAPEKIAAIDAHFEANRDAIFALKKEIYSRDT